MHCTWVWVDARPRVTHSCAIVDCTLALSYDRSSPFGVSLWHPRGRGFIRFVYLLAPFCIVCLLSLVPGVSLLLVLFYFVFVAPFFLLLASFFHSDPPGTPVISFASLCPSAIVGNLWFLLFTVCHPTIPFLFKMMNPLDGHWVF